MSNVEKKGRENEINIIDITRGRGERDRDIDGSIQDNSVSRRESVSWSFLWHYRILST